MNPSPSTEKASSAPDILAADLISGKVGTSHTAKLKEVKVAFAYHYVQGTKAPIPRNLKVLQTDCATPQYYVGFLLGGKPT